jgi:hypothetical protein
MICLDTTALGKERASGGDTQPIADLLTGPIEVLPFELPAEVPKALLIPACQHSGRPTD